MELTSHALLRCDQRRISRDDIEVVMDYGTRVHNGGALFCFMRRKDVSGDLRPARGDRLEGLTVVLDSTGQNVLTVYRNRQALRDIKRKMKRRMRHNPLEYRAA